MTIETDGLGDEPDFDSVFIDGDGALEARYGTRLPVLRDARGRELDWPFDGRRVAAFCGRRHWYEGVGWTPVALPVDLLRRMGARRLVLTNAAGGMDPALKPGDFLMVRDHINTTGLTPLQGPVVPGWGPRFPDQSRVYAPALAGALRQCAIAAGIVLTNASKMLTNERMMAKQAAMNMTFGS